MSIMSRTRDFEARVLAAEGKYLCNGACRRADPHFFPGMANAVSLTRIEI